MRDIDQEKLYASIRDRATKKGRYILLNNNIPVFHGHEADMVELILNQYIKDNKIDHLAVHIMGQEDDIPAKQFMSEHASTYPELIKEFLEFLKELLK